MGINMKVKYTIDSMKYRYKSILFTVVLLAVSLTLFGVLLFYQGYSRYNRSVCDSILTKGIKGTNLIRIEDFFSENALKFREKAKELDSIDCIGEVSDGATNFLTELQQIQEGHKEMEYKDSIEMIYLDEQSVDLCELDFVEKREIDTTGKNRATWSGLYLGNAYQDIPVGTIYSYKLENNIEVTFEVMGILKAGEKYINSNITNGAIGLNSKDYTILDYAVICVSNDVPIISNWVYSVADGYTTEQAKQSLKDLSEELSISVEFASLEKYFDSVKSKEEEMNHLLLQLLVMATIVSVIVSVSIQIVAFLNSSNEYGILYSLGASQKNLISIVSLEVIVKNIAALILAGIGTTLLVNKTTVYSIQTFYMTKEILLQSVFPKMIIFSLFNIVLILVLPCLILHNKTTVELMKGRRI